MGSRKPVIGIPADRRLLGPHWFHCVGEKYIAAVAEAAGAVPVVVPALGEQHLEEWLDSFDGILFTGSPSNVEPRRYQGPPSDPGTWHDPERDATTLPMIPAAVAAGLPLLGICRGFQEMNVAFGGTLWQKLQEVPGYLDHREDKEAPLDVQYGPAHDVDLARAKVGSDGRQLPRAQEALSDADGFTELRSADPTRPRCLFQLNTRPMPEYPDQQLSRSAVAGVVLRLRIDAAGRVAESDTVPRVGDEAFSRALERTAPRWSVTVRADSPADCRMESILLVPVSFSTRP